MTMQTLHGLYERAVGFPAKNVGYGWPPIEEYAVVRLLGIFCLCVTYCL